MQFVTRNAHEISESLDAHLAVLLGPRLDSSSFAAESQSLSIIPFTMDSLKYFKAADCVVTQAGASTLNEVAALGTSCVCIPISNHWEQRHNSDRFARQYGFGVLDYSSLSKEELKRAIERAISHKYEQLDASGTSALAAKLVLESMDL